MKQVLQSLKTGITEVADVPSPAAGPGQILIRSSRTLVSAGTERSLVAFGRANLLEKARQQPDRVVQVIEKMKTDGIAPTLEAVFNKLDQPLPLGYCNVGIVEQVGAGVSGFAVGDRVVSNGKHAEIVAVPKNLCAHVPQVVSDDEAAFTVLGAIALQGIRLVNPTLGETVVVTGLGLVGLMAVQLLLANGCRVLGIDFDKDKLARAKDLGAEVVDLSEQTDVVAAAMAFSRHRGVDAVIITASTKSSEPVHQAAQMSRKRGRIVLVGVTGLELSRADFYEKELSFQVSCSYGPGRYDSGYEEGGNDYPVGFVRWTEQRNFEAVLDMMASERLLASAMISHRFDIGEASEAYALIESTEPSLGILLDYPQTSVPERMLTRTVVLRQPSAKSHPARIAFVGAGNYARAMLIPAFVSAKADLVSIVSNGGVTGLHAARKFGIASATTDVNAVLQDVSIGAVVIATRHSSHADLTCRALEHGKHVYVEKPLATTREQLAQIEAAGAEAPMATLMVGFNRRFAPHVIKIKSLLAGAPGPKSFVLMVNAGAVPLSHWTQDKGDGGGRIIGEACHFIDLLRHLAGASIVSHNVTRMSAATDDTVSIGLTFADGSIGAIHYFANGPKSFQKERLEVFAGGRLLQLDNFRVLRGYNWPSFSSQRLWRQDKGQNGAVQAFVNAVSNNTDAPIPRDELFEVARVTIEIAESA